MQVLQYIDRFDEEKMSKKTKTESKQDEKLHDEKDEVIEKEQEGKSTSPIHENGNVRNRKQKQVSNQKQKSLTKRNQELKKLLASKSSGKDKGSIATLEEILTGNTCVVAFMAAVALTIGTRFYTLTIPTHIW